MKQLKYLFLLSLNIISFSCTRSYTVIVVARITIANEEGVPFKAKDASRFIIRPVGNRFYSENGVFMDVNDLVYEQKFSNVEGIRI